MKNCINPWFPVIKRLSVVTSYDSSVGSDVFFSKTPSHEGERFALANRAGDSAFKEGSLPCAMVDFLLVVCWCSVCWVRFFSGSEIGGEWWRDDVDVFASCLFLG